MLPIHALRRDNLRNLVAERGGPTSVSKVLGYSNGSFLAQLIGPNPRREISEKIAREMEDRLAIPAGSLDRTDDPRSLETHPLAAAFETLINELGEAGLRQISEDKFGELSALLLEEYRERNEVREVMIKRLAKLAAK